MNIFSKIYSIIIFLAIIFSAGAYYLSAHLLSSAFAIEKKSEYFSARFEGEPLKKVLAELSEKSGNTITVNEKWEDWPVTVTLTNVTVHRALKQILGKLNHAIVYKGEKAVFITVHGSPQVKVSTQQSFDPLDVEVIPPTEPDGKGITQREMDAIRAQQEKIDPLDVEIIPPTEPGGKGITQREMDAIRAQQEKIDPLDMEIIPPTEPGGKGITQRELNAMLANQKKIDPLDMEIIPPTEPGGKGMTQREMDAIIAKRELNTKSNNSQKIEISPKDIDERLPAEPEEY
jgi:hypothetical protein